MQRGSGESHAGHDMAGHGQPAHDTDTDTDTAAGKHAGHHGGTPKMPLVTRPQLAAVAIVTTLALFATPLWAASKVNMGLSAHDVGGAVMPPGMVMTRDTPAEAMRDMAAVDPGLTTSHPPASTKGAQVLAPRLDGEVKVFDLTASVITWRILDGQTMHAYALNGQVPGPTLRLTQGDRVRINLINKLPESTTLHWHGLILPKRDGRPSRNHPRPCGAR